MCQLRFPRVHSMGTKRNMVDFLDAIRINFRYDSMFAGAWNTFLHSDGGLEMDWTMCDGTINFFSIAVYPQQSLA